MCRDLLDDVILLSEVEIAAGIRHAYAQTRDRRRRRRGWRRCAARRQGQGERTGGGSPLRPEISTWACHRKIVCGEVVAEHVA